MLIKILLQTLAVLSSAAIAPAVATPNPVERTTGTFSFTDGILAGPFSYAELQVEVAELKFNGTIAERSALTKRDTEGVYMCDEPNFAGSCYYGQYPDGTAIYPDPYWVPIIVSVGPDQYPGGYCLFFGCDCDASACDHDYFTYPGGNLDPPTLGNLQCFYCN